MIGVACAAHADNGAVLGAIAVPFMWSVIAVFLLAVVTSAPVLPIVRVNPFNEAVASTAVPVTINGCSNNNL